MPCPKCGKEISKEAKFCRECGFDLTNLKKRHTNETKSTKYTSLKVAFKVGIAMIAILLFGFDSELKHNLIPRRFEITIKSPYILRSKFPKEFGGLEFGMTPEEAYNAIVTRGYKFVSHTIGGDPIKQNQPSLPYGSFNISTVDISWDLILVPPGYVSVGFDHNRRLNRFFMIFPKSLNVNGIINTLYKSFGTPLEKPEDGSFLLTSWVWNDGETELRINKKDEYIMAFKKITGKNSQQYWESIEKNEVKCNLWLGMSIEEFKEEIKFDLKPEPKDSWNDEYEESYELKTILIESKPIIPMKGLYEIKFNFWKNQLYRIKFQFKGQEIDRSEWNDFRNKIKVFDDGKTTLDFHEFRPITFSDNSLANLLNVKREANSKVRRLQKITQIIPKFTGDLKILCDETLNVVAPLKYSHWRSVREELIEFMVGNNKYALEYFIHESGYATEYDLFTDLQLSLLKNSSQVARKALHANRLNYNKGDTLIEYNNSNFYIVVTLGLACTREKEGKEYFDNIFLDVVAVQANFE